MRLSYLARELASIDRLSPQAWYSLCFYVIYGAVFVLPVQNLNTCYTREYSCECLQNIRIKNILFIYSSINIIYTFFSFHSNEWPTHERKILLVFMFLEE